MSETYFRRLSEETPTRFWVNNPSAADMDKAIAAGAINCTTNPAYCQKLLSSDTDYIHSVIDQVIQETKDNEEAAVLVYRRVSARVMEYAKRLGLDEYRDLSFDDHYLPTGLVSEGALEGDDPVSLDAESYGTVEQLALLVRLALGGLLAEDETQVAILDDPLAH